jgi:hypothetical protein
MREKAFRIAQMKRMIASEPLLNIKVKKTATPNVFAA